jgi:hypothetical protein
VSTHVDKISSLEVEIPDPPPPGWKIRTIGGLFLHLSKEAPGRITVVTYGPALDRPGRQLWHADSAVYGRSRYETRAQLGDLLTHLDTTIFKEAAA